MPAIGKYTLELRCDDIWHDGKRTPYSVTGEHGVECRAYARELGWTVGTTQTVCPDCIKNHAKRVARRKLEREKRQKVPSKCPRCAGRTGFIFMERGRIVSRRWRHYKEQDAKCRDCERTIKPESKHE